MQSTSGEKPLNYKDMVDIEIYELKFSEHKNYYDFLIWENLLRNFCKMLGKGFRIETLVVEL